MTLWTLSDQVWWSETDHDPGGSQWIYAVPSCHKALISQTLLLLPTDHSCALVYNRVCCKQLASKHIIRSLLWEFLESEHVHSNAVISWLPCFTCDRMSHVDKKKKKMGMKMFWQGFVFQKQDRETVLFPQTEKLNLLQRVNPAVVAWNGTLPFHSDHPPGWDLRLHVLKNSWSIFILKLHYVIVCIKWLLIVKLQQCFTTVASLPCCRYSYQCLKTDYNKNCIYWYSYSFHTIIS